MCVFCSLQCPFGYWLDLMKRRTSRKKRTKISEKKNKRFFLGIFRNYGNKWSSSCVFELMKKISYILIKWTNDSPIINSNINEQIKNGKKLFGQFKWLMYTINCCVANGGQSELSEMPRLSCSNECVSGLSPQKISYVVC